MTHENREEWLLAYLQPLEGATITKVQAVQDEEGLWPTLIVQTKDGESFELQISQDEEGNGPGTIFGLPVPGRPKVYGPVTPEQVEALKAALAKAEEEG